MSRFFELDGGFTLHEKLSEYLANIVFDLQR